MAGEKGNSSTPPEARFLPTAPRPFVFVLMPFSKEFDDIYTFGIKGAAEEVGAYAERVDEQIFVENILERVYNQIAKADMIISEMTGRNPNVFYETGYAHALGKKVILLTQNAEDIPFDLRQYPHIVYGGKISVLKSQIANRIRWFIENPDTYMRSVEGNFEVFINGIRIIENRIVEGSVTKYTTINVSEDLKHQRELYDVYSRDTNDIERIFIPANIGIHSLSKRLIPADSFKVSLVIPSNIRFALHKHQPQAISFFSSGAQLPDGKRIYNLQPSDIFPDGWYSIGDFAFTLRLDRADSSFEISLRLFTELEALYYPVMIDLTESRSQSETVGGGGGRRFLR